MDATPVTPCIDPDAIRKFCEVVFGYLDGHVPVRLLSEAGMPPRKAVLPFPRVAEVADVLIAEAANAARTGRGVFVVPGTVTSPGSAKAPDIVQTGVVLIDLDLGDIQGKRDHLVRHLGEPALEIASGGLTAEGQPKLHLYWRLTEAASGEDLQRVCGLRRLLAEKVGGDRSFASAHQPIRVAGTIHGKHACLAPVRLLAHRSVEADLDELDERTTAMPAFPGSSDQVGIEPVGGAVPSAAQLRLMPIRAGGRDEITRFEALSRKIGRCVNEVRRGRGTPEDAWLAVCQYNTKVIVPPWNEDRLRREFDALLAKDLREKGPMPPRPSAGGSTGIAPPALSEDALAAAFAAERGGDWAYVAGLGWLYWDDRVWRRDVTGRVREEVRQVCRAATVGLDAPHHARRVASDKTIGAVMRIASADPAIACGADQFDAHPMLLNTPAGTIDLVTGELCPHDRRCRLTQVTGVAPGGDCPRWLSFLSEVTDKDEDMQAYLARLAGYCLTGSTREQMFAFLHGPGGNGKSVFVQTIAAAMGDYAATATLDTFMASAQSHHLTDLAGLRAARLVLVPETDTGRGWAEGRIKLVTGGEKIRANFMRQDHFEYRPQFKLIVAGNHRPSLQGTGEAMRRRLHLVPFEAKIPPASRDPHLSGTLEKELGGILAWMINGCVSWQREGLSPPRRIMNAVAEYLKSEDVVGQWIEERCDLAASASERSSKLFHSWRVWTEQRGYQPGSQKSLGEALRGRGLRDGKVFRERGWHGICLRPETSEAELDK